LEALVQLVWPHLYHRCELLITFDLNLLDWGLFFGNSEGRFRVFGYLVKKIYATFGANLCFGR